MNTICFLRIEYLEYSPSEYMHIIVKVLSMLLHRYASVEMNWTRGWGLPSGYHFEKLSNKMLLQIRKH